MKRFDVVVVGARCAGSPLAATLARQGLSVCLVDRAQFPSETPSTHIIQPGGTRLLDQLGVLDTVLAAGAVPLDRMTMVIDDAVRIEATVDRAVSTHPSLCVRRVTLDALLVDAAAAAGADVRTGVRVTGLLTENGRVTGVDTAAGPIEGQLVVGADGRHSTLAALVGAREYHVAPAGKMFAWGYFEQVHDREGHARLGRRGDVGFLAGPTDGELYMAAIAIDMAKQADFHANRDANFTAGLRAWPELADVIGDGRRVGPIRVLTNWHGYFRESAGPGWVLVGDAGHFKDPAPGQGISDAFRQAHRLARSVEDGLGNTSPDEATQRWWRWRDDDAYEMHWFASDFGASGAATLFNTHLMRNVAADPKATQMLFGVLNHQIRPSQLFTTRGRRRHHLRHRLAPNTSVSCPRSRVGGFVRQQLPALPAHPFAHRTAAGFIGYASSTACQLTSEISAHWLSQNFRGELSLPAVDDMEAKIQRVHAWLREVFPNRPDGYFLGPYLTHHIDDLLADMGLPTRRTRNVLTEYLGSFSPARYRDVAEQRRSSQALADRPL